MMRETKIQFIYGSFSFYITIINSLFILYHVDAYVNVFKIDKKEFWIGETIFMAWNCLNDPLFAWLSDRELLDSSNAHGTKYICLRRLTQLKKYGPALALFFLFIWLPFSSTYIWLQFPLSLCLYDSFLTICDLQHSALLADLEVSSLKRNNFNYFSSLFASCGVLSIFLSYPIWSLTEFVNFQFYCAFITVISFIGFRVSSAKLRDLLDAQESPYQQQQRYLTKNSRKKYEWNLINYVKLLPRHTNLFYFSLLNLIQVFSCHFNSNFFPLFIDIFLNGQQMKSVLGACLLGFSFLIPHLLNMYLARYCDTYGTYKVIKTLFIVKLMFATFMLAIGQSYCQLICIFLLSNRIFTEGICKLLNLIVADLTDEDFVLNERAQPVSALIYGTTSFLAKPGQTLAPLIGTLIISYQTGTDVFHLDSQKYHDTDFKSGCFKILLLIPIITAILQLFLWKKFDLHSNKLRIIKHKRLHVESQLFI